MDEYIENRFGYLKEKSIEDLLKTKEEIEEEIEYLLRVLEDKNTSSEQKSEIKNSDLKYLKEKLTYINWLLPKNKTNRHM